MTGACFNNNYVYILGTNYSNAPVVARFTTTGSVSTYMTSFPGLGTGYRDIEYHPSGGFWIARDNPDSPVIAYNTGGTVTAYLETSVISAAMGLAVDNSGYIWVSNPDDDRIYQIDITTGTAEESSSPVAPASLSVSGTPFTTSVTVTGSGFGQASIRIFDISGRTLITAPFNGTYIWDASSASPGMYFARVSDGSLTLVARLVKTSN